MSVPTVALNEATPAGGDYIRGGDDRIREYKLQVREILEVDHNFPPSGQSAQAGYHKQIHLTEAADIGTGATGYPILGAQTVVAPELCYTDEADNDVIITDAGKIALQNARLPNNTYLIARNNADDGNINIFKVNTSDELEIPITLNIDVIAELTGAAGVIIDGCLVKDGLVADSNLLGGYAYNETEIKPLGSWASKSANTAYEATTDGLVVAGGVASGGSSVDAIGYSDTNSSPTTVRAQTTVYDAAVTTRASICFPVKKGDYWKVNADCSSFVYWIPLGV